MPLLLTAGLRSGGVEELRGNASPRGGVTNLMKVFFLSEQWWNVVTGESSQTFYTNGTNLKKIHVSPDFRTYVTVDNLGILYILQVLE